MGKDIVIKNKKKMIFLLPPFWTPMLPPLGIACLKSFLKENGYDILTIDVNSEDKFMYEYQKYFEVLKKYIPKENGGNFYKIGRDVLRNQMMAHINYTDFNEYICLTNELIYENFYVEFSNNQIIELIEVLNDFYKILEKYIVDLIEDQSPTLIGLSVYRDALPAAVFISRVVKLVNKEITTIMGGGVFADQLANDSLNLDIFLEKTKNSIDKIIIGEGEIILLKFLRGELPQWKRVYTKEDICNEVADISKLAIPDFSDFEIQRYPYVPHYTSRSCPFQCAFCSETVQWGKYRKKSSALIVDELIELYKRHNYQLFFLCDSLLNPIIDNLSEEFIKRDISIYWEGCLRAEKLVCDENRSLLWRKAGFYKAKLGVESGSQRILDMMNKGISIEQIKSAIYNLGKYGIKTLIYIIVGFEGETEEDFQKTIDLLEEMQDYIYEVEVTPFEYNLVGQSKSDGWSENNKNKLVYSKSINAKDMLITQTWCLDCEPSRQEVYKRFNRIMEKLKELNIPNIYSVNDMFKADERWKKLHSNSVPPIIDFLKRDIYISEDKKIINNKNIEIDDEELNFIF